jgi:glycosyltransferase involved in cell wall biosynthesis
LEIGVEWLYYYWWQWKAYRTAKKLHAEIGFDLAHHVTFASWRAPSFLCLLPVPLIWGPLGGGETTPWSLRSELSRKGRIFEAARDVCQGVSRWDPFVRMTMRRAALIITVNRDTMNILSPAGKKKARTITTIGMSPNEKTEPVTADKKEGELVILFVARLDPHKGCGLAIQAFRQLVKSHANARLVIIGNGPERVRLEAQAGDEARARAHSFFGQTAAPTGIGLDARGGPSFFSELAGFRRLGSFGSDGREQTGGLS